MDFSRNEALLAAQRHEITAHYVYKALARLQNDPESRAMLERIAEDELRHAHLWSQLTGAHVEPHRLAVWRLLATTRIFGPTFTVKLMKRRDIYASRDVLAAFVEEAEHIAEDELRHEQQLLKLFDEERLRYMGSVVLGLSDALVELTAALAGLTLALAQTRLVAMVGLITGIAAAMSMAASEYLSTKTEDGHNRSPLKAALYTGITYLLTVLLLIAPYLLAPNVIIALLTTLTLAMVLVLFFTYYMSVIKELPFWPRFGEMAGLTLAVTAASFIFGFAVRLFFDIDV